MLQTSLMRRVSGGLLALFFFLVSASAAPSSRDTIPGYHRVELTRGPQNHLLMPATINGRSATFLVDTAIDLSLLRAEGGKNFGLRSLPQQVRTAGQFLPAGETELSAGGANLGRETFALYQASQLGGPIPGLKGSRADGIIGLNFLRRYKAVINCRSRHLFLKTDPARRMDASNAMKAGFARVPLEEDRRGYLTVPCKIRGRSGRLLLDTGAFLTSIDDGAARALGVTASPSKITARGLDGKVRPVDLAQVDDLQLGGVPIAPQKFVVIDVFGRRTPLRTFTGMGRLEYFVPRKIAPGDTIFGLLGNELLDQRRAIIDFEEMALYLK